MNISMQMYKYNMYIYIYIYTYTERERERCPRSLSLSMSLCADILCIYLHLMVVVSCETKFAEQVPRVFHPLASSGATGSA